MLGSMSLQASPAGVAAQSNTFRAVLSKGKAQQAPNAEVFPGARPAGLLITLQSWFISSVYR